MSHDTRPFGKSTPYIFLGTLFQSICVGIYHQQYYAYTKTRKSKEDPRWLKVLIHWIFFVVNASFVLFSTYSYLAIMAPHGRTAKDFEQAFSRNSVIISLALAAGTVQGFYIWRIRRLQKRLREVVVLSFLMTIELILAILGIIFLGFNNSVPAIVSLKKLTMASVIILVPILDLGIAVALIVALSSHRTGFAHSDATLRKIIRLTTETGLLTALVAICAFVMVMINNDNSSDIATFPSPAIYGICLMANLNAREKWASIWMASREVKMDSALDNMEPKILAKHV